MRYFLIGMSDTESSNKCICKAFKEKLFSHNISCYPPSLQPYPLMATKE